MWREAHHQPPDSFDLSLSLAEQPPDSFDLRPSLAEQPRGQLRPAPELRRAAAGTGKNPCKTPRRCARRASLIKDNPHPVVAILSILASALSACVALALAWPQTWSIGEHTDLLARYTALMAKTLGVALALTLVPQILETGGSATATATATATGESPEISN
ncbi:MAG: hypothetical protein ABI193_18680, partial [Minicystis sp.]